MMSGCLSVYSNWNLGYSTIKRVDVLVNLWIRQLLIARKRDLMVRD